MVKDLSKNGQRLLTSPTAQQTIRSRMTKGDAFLLCHSEYTERQQRVTKDIAYDFASLTKDQLADKYSCYLY